MIMPFVNNNLFQPHTERFEKELLEQMNKQLIQLS